MTTRHKTRIKTDMNTIRDKDGNYPVEYKNMHVKIWQY